MNYEDWISEVDAELIRVIGLDTDDLGDALIADMYDDGMTPAEAAAEIAANDRNVLAVYGDEDAVYELFDN